MRTLYQVGPFRLDREAGVLTHDGVAVDLGARAVSVLSVLVERAHEYVPKTAILDAAWPGLVVEEANLPVQISAIRRALSRVPGAERWIETLPRRGYRFVGPVREGSSPDGSPSFEGARASGAPARHNLPERISSFVGRAREVAEVERLLDRHRLVALVGVGGIGKTRVALRVAADLVDSYPDGIWLVEFGSINDPRLVPISVAQVLGIQEQTSTSLTQTLCQHLASRRLLLVLDTCEHVINATAALVAALLSQTTELRVLVTSREALSLEGEQRVPLPPLSLPSHESAREAGPGADAVQLFVERARLQRPDFRLTDRQAPVVASICRRLDGLPLAIELAAARTASLSIDEIDRRLADRFKLLTGGVRAASPRQRTLRATLDWSYELLPEEDRCVLRRLGVFAGGFTLEPARLVAAERTSDEPAMLDQLSRLAARSLLVAEPGDAGTRFRLLDTMRAYLLERLDDAGERQLASERHAHYFRDRFEQTLEDWLRLSDAEWDATYLPERDNVRAALDWSLSAHGDQSAGVALAAGSGPAWLLWSLRSEGLQRLEGALAACDSHTPARSRARLRLWLGVLGQFRDPKASVRSLRRSVALHRTAGDPFGGAYALIRLAGGLARGGRVALAQEALDAALPLLEGIDTPTVMAPYFHVSGLVRKLAGDLVAARDSCRKAVTLYRACGAERSELEMLGALADTNWALGALDAALADFREIVDRMRSSNRTTKLILGVNLTNLAGVLTELGKLDEALSMAREGLGLRRETGYVWGALDHLALRAALAGKFTDAARVAGYADSVFAAKHALRQPNEARARARVDRLLHEQPEAEALAAAMTEGATMTEDEACRLALAD